MELIKTQCLVTRQEGSLELGTQPGGRQSVQDKPGILPDGRMARALLFPPGNPSSSVVMRMWGRGKFPYPLLVTPEKPGLAASHCCVSCALHSTDGRQRDRYLLTFLWTVSSKALKLPTAHIYLGMLLLSLKNETSLYLPPEAGHSACP